MPESKIPSICPKCRRSVKFWHNDKGHVVTVACDELEKYGLKFVEPKEPAE